MVIGFCGRMRSGKGELASVCEKYGYKRLSFATPLKELCSSLLGISIDELNKLKNNNSEIFFCLTSDVCNVISRQTDIPLDVVEAICLEKVVPTVRNMLQQIGTTLIRSYNYNWHVDKIREMMQDDSDCVLDDVRFPNEKSMIESMGGDCWFVVRPTLENISNHESETSLKWNSCGDKVIINDSSLSDLLFKWENFMLDYKANVSVRDNELKRIFQDGLKGSIEPLSELDGLLINKWLFTKRNLKLPKKEGIVSIVKTDVGVVITPTSGMPITLTNPLEIEEAKILL